jgi:hypothetical protein
MSKELPPPPKLASSMVPKQASQQFQPKQIINPATFTAVTLDDISVKLSKLVDLNIQNQKLLISNQNTLGSILEQLLEEADEGQELTQDGTVLNTDFTFIDLGQLRQGLRVKSFELSNDHATNGLYFGWNVTEGGLQPSLDDPVSSLTKFRILNAGDSIKIIFNRKVIRNIALISQQGSVPYRLWMVW